MNITAAMIQFVLSRQGVETQLFGNSSCEVARVAEYRDTRREPGTLYASEGPDAVKKPSKGDSHAVLQAEHGPGDNAGDAPNEAPTLLERTFSAMHALDRWDAELKDALLQRVPFAEFLRIGAKLFSCPIAYFDRNLITLASTEEYWERHDVTSEKGLHIAGQMPSELAVDLVEDFDYLKAAEHLEPFYYENAQNRIFYGVNTFDGGEYLARLVFALPEGVKRLHLGEEQLIALYHEYLDQLHLHFAGNVDIVSTQNDSLHALVRATLLEGERPALDEMAGVLAAFGWDAHDEFAAAKIVFFEGVHWDSISLYLCGLLERAMPASCAFPIDRQIAWLVNLTQSAWAGETPDRESERMMEALVSIMRDYACKAGLSDRFCALSDAHDYYLEAARALEVGQRRKPHDWYYRFSDYAFDYLLAKGTEELAGNLLCHPALIALITHDERNDTEYARTLVCFLRNNQNTTRAADELFIHRTSLMRRLAQMREIAPVDLDDPDEVLHLLLSAKLLGM